MATATECTSEWDQLFSSTDSVPGNNAGENASTAKSSLPPGKERRANGGEEQEDDEEAAHFDTIVDAFLYYRRHSEIKLRSKVKTLRSIPKDHLALIPRFRDQLRKVHRCVCTNYDFLRSVVLATGNIFENRRAHCRQSEEDQNNNDGENVYAPTASEFNMDKLHSTLRQVVRDWTREGAAERGQCYWPILDRLRALWPREEDRASVRVLVPGAGLGRLAFEVARAGFECQGNEFSLFMLFVSNFILNHCRVVDEWTLFPYVHQWMNNCAYEDQTRPVQLPDANPSDLPPSAKFSMTAGDFLDVYGAHEGQWDAVVTVFFLDTAHNIIAYLEAIHRILKPNGYWLNFGPLLYHFADMENEVSLELPYEEILNVSKRIGFEIVSEDSKVPTTYTQNSRSMLQYLYQCAFVVFRKSA